MVSCRPNDDSDLLEPLQLSYHLRAKLCVTKGL